MHSKLVKNIIHRCTLDDACTQRSTEVFLESMLKYKCARTSICLFSLTDGQDGTEVELKSLIIVKDDSDRKCRTVGQRDFWGFHRSLALSLARSLYLSFPPWAWAYCRPVFLIPFPSLSCFLSPPSPHPPLTALVHSGLQLLLVYQTRRQYVPQEMRQWRR